MNDIENILRATALLETAKEVKESVRDLNDFIASSVTSGQYDVLREVEKVQTLRKLLDSLTVHFLEVAQPLGGVKKSD